MTVLITGASGGIGSEMAKAFAKAGYKVAINYNSSEDKAVKIAEEIIADGGIAKIYKCDVSNSKEVNEMVVKILEDFTTIDVLVNNAAVSYQGLVTDVTDLVYSKIMDVNVKGSFNVTRAVLPGMVRRKAGSIINISSMWGEVGASCEVVYSTSKAAIIGFTKSLAKETGLSGIRVNCITPGVIDTAMNSMHSPETMRSLIEDTPLERIGTPKDIAKAALFLVSEDASFITGQVLGVNGGFVI